MTKDLYALSQTMFKVAKAVEKDINELVQDIALFVVADVSRGTPVDVGTARSNWQVVIGEGPIGQRKAYAPYPSRHRPPYGSGGSIGEGRNQLGTVQAARGILSRRRTDQEILIGNSLPYIKRLNDGYSDQSPAGFVQRGVISGTKRATNSFKFKNVERIV